MIVFLLSVIQEIQKVAEGFERKKLMRNSSHFSQSICIFRGSKVFGHTNITVDITTVFNTGMKILLQSINILHS